LTADLTRLEELVESFTKQTVVVLADLVADRFVSGDISRVSREAPVLILRHRETELLPGGGAHATNNLVDLGAHVLAVGAIGDDDAGRALVSYFKMKNVDVSGLVRAPGWSTPVKTRYLAGWTHTTRQQVLRVDHEPQTPLSATTQRTLLKKTAQRIRRSNVLLASDYGFGSVTPLSLKSLRRTAGTKLKITLDSRYCLGDYRAAGITAATPNESELESMHHTRTSNNPASVETLGQQTLKALHLEALVLTRGKDGMVIFERNNKPKHIPVYGSDEAADVTGAGDTVIAVFTLALAAGATYSEAAELANYAAGIVVMKRGTATVRREELLTALRNEATGKNRVL
jgi:rfaE bifunctional protein kinase chain/domain